MNKDYATEEEIQDMAISRLLNDTKPEGPYALSHEAIQEYIKLFDEIAALEAPQLDIVTRDKILNQIFANHQLEKETEHAAIKISLSYTMLVVLIIMVIVLIVDMGIVLTAFNGLLIIFIATASLFVALRDALNSYYLKIDRLCSDDCNLLKT